MSPSFHTLSKTLDIQEKLHENKELDIHQRLYKFYGQWTVIDILKNHWLKNKVDELIVVCSFQDTQTKN